MFDPRILPKVFGYKYLCRGTISLHSTFTSKFAMDSFPPELLSRICQAVYNQSVPVYPSSLDPFPLATVLSASDKAPNGLPSSYPPATWPEALSRKTLASLCLTNKALHYAAKPWLWLRIEVRLPSSWLALLEVIVGLPEEGPQLPDALAVAEKQAVSNVIQQVSLPNGNMCPTQHDAIRQSFIASLDMEPPNGSIPPDLLSPVASREPSPRRLPIRAQSPGRWRLIRAISNAFQAAIDNSLHCTVPTVNDQHPGRHIRHLDFNHFRTIGMRRLVEEGVSNRFVTSDRVYSLLQETPNLTTFGATEYMDGALSFDVLTELLMRGSVASGPHARPAPLLQTVETEEELWSRRAESSPLEAIDFCGCVSAVFVEGATQFVETFLTPKVEEHESRRARGRRNESPRVEEGWFPSFPSVHRLGLRGAKSLAANVLEPFVLAFSNLTDLDLSGTRCAPSLLFALGASSSIHLRALALGRCPALTGESIEWLLTSGRATYGLQHLSLYGDFTFPSPLTEDQLNAIVTRAPSFLSGKFEYLDLSSNPLTPVILQRFTPQPHLRSLGLSYISALPLKAISEFVLHKCTNLEILTLISTSPQLLGPRGSASLGLHQEIIAPLAKAPFSFSFSLSEGSETKPLPPATNLRVVELSSAALAALGGGSEGWRIIRSKGGRAWYVDSRAGWVGESTCETNAAGMHVDGEMRSSGAVLRRDLPNGHPLRVEYERLANACGNVSSGVGWHARKMEILRGEGLLGREEGLYGAVSFAYSS